VSIPLLLGQLGELQRGPFAFYPAIVGIEHNEWTLKRATWTEVEVQNTKTGAQVLIPRTLLGEVSSVEAPVVIVGLVKELEYKEGVVVPHRRRVLVMPRAVNGAARATVAETEADGPRLAPVIAIRTEPADTFRTRRWLRGSVAAGILACITGGVLLRDAGFLARPGWLRSGVRTVELMAADDYTSVIQKLGRPYSDQWLKTPTGEEYRRLWYSRRGVAVILAGPDRQSARYAGALNSAGVIVHAAAPALLHRVSDVSRGSELKSADR
jgi:hypothetical protein